MKAPCGSLNLIVERFFNFLYLVNERALVLQTYFANFKYIQNYNIYTFIKLFTPTLITLELI